MLRRPEGMKDVEYGKFMRYCTEFFVASDKLWRKDHRGEHKLVVTQSKRIFILNSAHNNVGHHGYFATNALISQRYWWPFMGNDIAWFVKTCRLCQLRQTQNVLIPPTALLKELTSTSGRRYSRQQMENNRNGRRSSTQCFGQTELQ